MMNMMITMLLNRLFSKATSRIITIILIYNEIYPIAATQIEPEDGSSLTLQHQILDPSSTSKTSSFIAAVPPKSHYLRRINKDSDNIKRQTELNGGVGQPPNDQFIWRWDLNHRRSSSPSSTTMGQGNMNSNIPNHGDNYNGNAINPNDPNNSSGSGSGSTTGTNNNNNNNNNNSTDSNNNSNNSSRNNESNQNTQNNQTNKPPLILIVQDTTPGPDEEVLYVTSKVNRAYAKRWGFDYLQFTGIAVGGSHSWQGTYNKPFLLNKLMEVRIKNQNAKLNSHSASCNGNIDDGDSSTSTSSSTSNNNANERNSLDFMMSNNELSSEIDTTNNSTTACPSKSSVESYDIVMFLDSSAIIVELDYDILSLINTDKMIAKSLNKDATNNGDVMLWNLNHPDTQYVADTWMEECYLNSGVIKNYLHIHKIQSEAILTDILIRSGGSGSYGGNYGGGGGGGSGGNTYNNNNDNNNGNNLHQVIDDIPFDMVDGLQGTLVKQDMSYNDYMIEVSDLRRVMPIVTGIADSVCYRFYPQCEII